MAQAEVPSHDRGVWCPEAIFPVPGRRTGMSKGPGAGGAAEEQIQPPLGAFLALPRLPLLWGPFPDVHLCPGPTWFCSSQEHCDACASKGQGRALQSFTVLRRPRGTRGLPQPPAGSQVSPRSWQPGLASGRPPLPHLCISPPLLPTSSSSGPSLWAKPLLQTPRLLRGRPGQGLGGRWP